ncbi:MAG: hypothetical protein JWP95_1416 [Actinotalea sp.]|nr:hypothetical protein [Actinotalea sp.]
MVVTGKEDASDITRPPENRGGTENYTYARVPQFYCGTSNGLNSRNPCVDGAPSGRIVRPCADGSTALDPLFRRELDPVTGIQIGLWEQVDNGGCPEDPPAPVIVLSTEDFRRLPLAASVISAQPADGRGLVNKDLVVYTEAASQTVQTVVLDVPVTVQATPTTYTWTFGDGSPGLSTSDPGAPWPNHTVAHPFTQPGSYQVQLTTTWSGQFQVDGAGPWLPVAGTAQTVSSPFTATVEEARTYLVAESGG